MGETVSFFEEPKAAEIPLPLVMVIGLTIWAVMFGTIAVHAAVSPCNFIRLNAGTPNIKTMTQLGYDLADDSTCKMMIKSIVVNDPSEFPDAPAIENR